MELNGYGIRLKRLTKYDIEMLRLWRNSKEVNQYMEFKGHISIEMQKKWFASLDIKKDFYFIIYENDYPVGLTEIKNIYDNRGNLGIFIADQDSLKIPMLSYKVIFTMIDFSFNELGLSTIEASILKSNPRAIRFNESFGFSRKAGQEEVENQLYILNENRYSLQSEKIKKIIKR